jgi:hypothetical protein
MKTGCVQGRPMASTARLFMHGRSRAVRLPKEFRLPGKEDAGGKSATRPSSIR